MIGAHLIDFRPVARPSGKVLGTASIALGDDLTITDVPVSFYDAGIAVGSPSCRTIKGNIHIGGQVIRDASIKLRPQDFSDLPSTFISELRSTHR